MNTISVLFPSQTSFLTKIEKLDFSNFSTKQKFDFNAAADCIASIFKIKKFVEGKVSLQQLDDYSYGCDFCCDQVRILLHDFSKIPKDFQTELLGILLRLVSQCIDSGISVELTSN